MNSLHYFNIIIMIIPLSTPRSTKRAFSFKIRFRIGIYFTYIFPSLCCCETVQKPDLLILDLFFILWSYSLLSQRPTFFSLLNYINITIFTFAILQLTLNWPLTQEFWNALSCTCISPLEASLAWRHQLVFKL